MSSNLMEDKKGKAWRLKCLLKTSPIQGRITILISDTELTAMPDNFLFGSTNTLIYANTGTLQSSSPPASLL
jgi:hypothetical protein